MVLVCAALGALACAVVAGVAPKIIAGSVVLVTLGALLRSGYVGWPRLMAALILVIFLIPIRRYSLPVNLPFKLEPYRIFVFILVALWAGALLVDARTRLRRTGLEGPILLIVGATLASIVANQSRVAQVAGVDKRVMFFFTFVAMLYLTATTIRRLDEVDYLTKILVTGGAIVAASSIVEARTGFNAFNHLSRVLPVLRPEDAGGTDMLRFGSAKLRVFGSSQHPIALSAMFVMLTPLAIYAWRRYRQRRWMLCAALLAAACAGTVSRTGIVMLIVVLLVFLWLRPRETRRFWPALIPMLVVIHFVLPGTIGALKQSFLPAGGLVAEQRGAAGTAGSGRVADIGPALTEWKASPLVGEGYGTRVVDGEESSTPTASILDDQWLSSLLETGALGVAGWLWLFARVIRRFGREAKRDESDRGWLLAAIVAAVASYAVGMLTYDAFSFIQVTFLMFIFVALGSSLVAERPTPLAVRDARAAAE